MVGAELICTESCDYIFHLRESRPSLAVAVLHLSQDGPSAVVLRRCDMTSSITARLLVDVDAISVDGYGVVMQGPWTRESLSQGKIHEHFINGKERN